MRARGPTVQAHARWPAKPSTLALTVDQSAGGFIDVVVALCQHCRQASGSQEGRQDRSAGMLVHRGTRHIAGLGCHKRHVGCTVSCHANAASHRVLLMLACCRQPAACRAHAQPSVSCTPMQARSMIPRLPPAPQPLTCADVVLRRTSRLFDAVNDLCRGARAGHGARQGGQPLPARGLGRRSASGGCRRPARGAAGGRRPHAVLPPSRRHDRQRPQTGERAFFARIALAPPSARRLRLPAVPVGMPRRMAGRGEVGTANMELMAVGGRVEGPGPAPPRQLAAPLTLGCHRRASTARGLLHGRHSALCSGAGSGGGVYGTLRGRMDAATRRAGLARSVKSDPGPCGRPGKPRSPKPPDHLPPCPQGQTASQPCLDQVYGSLHGRLGMRRAWLRTVRARRSFPAGPATWGSRGVSRGSTRAGGSSEQRERESAANKTIEQLKKEGQYCSKGAGSLGSGQQPAPAQRKQTMCRAEPRWTVQRRERRIAVGGRQSGRQRPASAWLEPCCHRHLGLSPKCLTARALPALWCATRVPGGCHTCLPAHSAGARRLARLPHCAGTACSARRRSSRSSASALNRSCRSCSFCD